MQSRSPKAQGSAGSKVRTNPSSSRAAAELCVILLTGNPYDAAGQMPSSWGRRRVLDKLDGLDQGREALLGRFPGWEALRKFFYEYRYHTDSAAEPLGTLCRLSEGVWRCH